MEIPQETDDYIRESINHSLGLTISTDALLLKLRAVEASHLHLRQQCLSMQSKLKTKDEAVERSRAEASMNAVALKKFVEENQKLATECSNLLAACNKWERECALYDHDREALMDFANEADERAKEAELRNLNLKEEKKLLEEELNFYKCQYQQLVGEPTDDTKEENHLLSSLFTTMFGKDEVVSTAHSFLEERTGIEVCKKLRTMWASLSPLTQKVVALAAKTKSLEDDKNHLTINLLRAEEEVNALFEENSVLNVENKRLMRQCYREKHNGGSSGKAKRKCSPKSSSVEKKIESSEVNLLRQPLSPLQSNSPESSAQEGKRKCSPKMSSSVEKKIDSSEVNLLRQPLLPLQFNSSESRMHKK